LRSRPKLRNRDVKLPLSSSIPNEGKSIIARKLAGDIGAISRASSSEEKPTRWAMMYRQELVNTYQHASNP
jgi:hypothetical protein